MKYPDLDDFEKWIGNPHMLNKHDRPNHRGVTKEQIAAWEYNPYEHPYTSGACAVWRFMQFKEAEKKGGADA